MSEGEGYREEGWGHETAGRARRRAVELRGQAELAWARVQKSVPRSGPPEISVDAVMDAAARVPSESYIAGIAASLVTSAWLYALGRRTASAYFGFLPPMAFTLGLYARFLRRREKGEG